MIYWIEIEDEELPRREEEELPRRVYPSRKRSAPKAIYTPSSFEDARKEEREAEKTARDIGELTACFPFSRFRSSAATMEEMGRQSTLKNSTPILIITEWLTLTSIRPSVAFFVDFLVATLREWFTLAQEKSFPWEAFVPLWPFPSLIWEMR
jgi:hypothetical protein